VFSRRTTCGRIFGLKQRARFAFTVAKLRGRHGRHVFTLLAPRGRSSFTRRKLRGRPAFTLIELLIVMAIISILLGLVAPTFTNLKGSNDATAAAYTISGALETARTYAKANNTYSWVGFYEEDGSKSSTIPPTPGPGRLVISIVASKDGTNVYGSSSGTINPTKLIQVGKLIKIDNIHVPLFNVGLGTGDTFDTRPVPDWDSFNGYNDSRFGELNAAPPNTAPPTTPHDFQYPVGNPAPSVQYTFKRILQFSPRGESRVNGDSYDIRHIVEIGMLQTHGNLVPTPVSGAGTSTATYTGNVAAVQISGFGSTVKIYRR
jgi:prepilin-type N-terminal cleavage/methylation domain-containing protein